MVSLPASKSPNTTVSSASSSVSSSSELCPPSTQVRPSAAFRDSEQWGLSFRSVFKAMKKMESQKYLPPKYSQYCRDLAEELGIYVSPTQNRDMSRESSLNSSKMSFNMSKDWDTNLHQYSSIRLEAMLIEESKITEKPPRFASVHTKRSDSFVDTTPHFDPRLQDSGKQRSKASYTSSRSKRRTNVSSVSPSRTRPFLGYTTNPHTSSRLSEVSEPRRRPHKREKLSEMYQMRAYSKLLSDLGT